MMLAVRLIVNIINNQLRRSGLLVARESSFEQRRDVMLPTSGIFVPGAIGAGDRLTSLKHGYDSITVKARKKAVSNRQLVNT